MTLTLTWYASLREARGCREERIDTDLQTPAEIYDSFDLPLARQHVKIAVNHHMAKWDDPLFNGDALAFIPPVAGG